MEINGFEENRMFKEKPVSRENGRFFTFERCHDKGQLIHTIAMWLLLARWVFSTWWKMS